MGGFGARVGVTIFAADPDRNGARDGMRLGKVLMCRVLRRPGLTTSPYYCFTPSSSFRIESPSLRVQFARTEELTQSSKQRWVGSRPAHDGV